MTASDTTSKGLPITLLSGFLGAGKTTLLQHILHNTDGLKCAVLVNDMASSNIDASNVVRSALGKADDAGAQKMVALQNGCVCCTLSDDMVSAIVEMSKEGHIDYIVIESSGVADPSETAGALTHGVIDDAAQTALRDIAYVDTCVTVVDAMTLLDNLHSIETVRSKLDETDEANVNGAGSYISQLLVDQIEFADVVILNKQDLLSAEDLKVAKHLLSCMNASAEVLCTTFSKVNLSQVVNTGRFDYDKASLASAWLHPRTEPASAEAPQLPETDAACSTARVDGQHGHEPAGHSLHHPSCHDPNCRKPDCCDHPHAHEHTSSCIRERLVLSLTYKARKPFHPKRILEFLLANFLVQEPDWKSELAMRSADAGRRGDSADPMGREASPSAPLDRSVAAQRQSARTQAFGMVLRSKGFAWVAGPARNDHSVEWNSSGNVLRFGTGGPWFACIPFGEWPMENIADIRGDFVDDEAIGDRRQEIVFIGANMKEDALRSQLDACLCSDAEIDEADTLQDSLAWWPSVAEMMGE